jgi:hypothetical protein
MEIKSIIFLGSWYLSFKFYIWDVQEQQGKFTKHCLWVNESQSQHLWSIHLLQMMWF